MPVDGTNFGGFFFFAIFLAIRKSKFPQIKITGNIFPQKFTPG